MNSKQLELLCKFITESHKQSNGARDFRVNCNYSLSHLGWVVVADWGYSHKTRKWKECKIFLETL